MRYMIKIKHVLHLIQVSGTLTVHHVHIMNQQWLSYEGDISNPDNHAKTPMEPTFYSDEIFELSSV